MIIYYSMIFWVLLMMFIYNNQHPEARANLTAINTNRVTTSFALLTIGYITFWAGIRSQFVDTAAYITGFNDMEIGISHIQDVWTKNIKSPGFSLFTLLFKTLISENYHWYLLCIAVISSAPICMVFKNKSINYFYSILLFVLSSDFIWLFNGIRQFLAVSILFYCGRFIENKQPKLWIITILLLSTIHQTVLIALPMYWFVTGKPFAKKMNIFIFAVMAISVFLNPFLSASEDLLEGSEYAANLEQMTEEAGVNPIRVLVMSVPTILAFIKRKEITECKDTFTNIVINMSTVSAGIFYIAMFTSGIEIGRLPMYFQLYNWLLIPYLIENYYTNQKRILYFVCTLGFFIFFLIQSQNLYYASDITGIIK